MTSDLFKPLGYIFEFLKMLENTHHQTIAGGGRCLIEPNGSRRKITRSTRSDGCRIVTNIAVNDEKCGSQVFSVNR